MFGKYNGFVSKSRVSACMYFLVIMYSIQKILYLNLSELAYPRADGANRRARVLIPPRLFTPGEREALAKTKVHH